MAGAGAAEPKLNPPGAGLGLLGAAGFEAALAENWNAGAGEDDTVVDVCPNPVD